MSEPLSDLPLPDAGVPRPDNHSQEPALTPDDSLLDAGVPRLDEPRPQPHHSAPLQHAGVPRPPDHLPHSLHSSSASDAGVPRPADDHDADDADDADTAGLDGELGDSLLDNLAHSTHRLGKPARGKRLVRDTDHKALAISPQQRLLLLDTWQRSGLPAGDFAALVGISKHTLYSWKRRFDLEGPAGLLDKPKGAAPGSKLPDLTKRTILLLKQNHPDWGCQKISDMLLRGPALPASPATVARVLHEAGYQLEEVPTRAHPDHVRSFERANPNQLWQSDLFSFVLKRQNRRVYLVAFLDDHSRFITGYGLHASQSTALVLEVLRAALTSHGAPAEILTDNGAQYVTWRGKSAFSKELEKRGIKQIVATPRRPQTLGKIERFWGTLWRECIESAIFLDLGDAQRRIGHFIDHYNFQRPHQGIDGAVPADRFFGAAPAVLDTLKQRVAANALELARQGLPRPPFYVTGQAGGQPFSLHAEGERVYLTRPGQRQEIDLVPPAASAGPAAVMPEPLCPQGAVDSAFEAGNEEPPAPGVSPLDDGLRQLHDALDGEEGEPS